MGIIIGAIKIIVLLGFLVLIHEGGHFLVAKKSNVKVLEFSIGFGKEIFSKQNGETKYSVRAIPLGGYVRMLGEEEASSDERAFNNAKIWKRILIVLAGATVNIVFGLVTFWILASLYNKNIYQGLIVTKRYIVDIFQGLLGLFSSVKKADMVGPVGISGMIVQTSSLFDFVYLLAVISVSLGITNLLPIPRIRWWKISFIDFRSN